MQRSTAIWAASLLGAMWGTAWLQAQEPSSEVPWRKALDQLLAVGPHAAGHDEAARAWQVVARGDAGQLPVLLAALDEAGPLPANWIRAAIDAIAERTLREGGKLPVEALERFVLDRSHAPRARRLAFEWLAEADATARQRLVPGFLFDPSVELRRDAVTRLLDEADRQPQSPEGKARKLALYREAFSGARDQDQVDLIAQFLQEAGDTVDLPAHWGFIVRWQVIGPFDNTGGRGFAAVYPPEKQIDLTASYPGKVGVVAWKEHTTSDSYGKIDLNAALGKHMGAAGYAYHEFISDAPRDVEIRVTSLCAVKVWVNGRLVMEHEVYHSGSRLDQYVAPAKLRAGSNAIVVKCCQNEQTEPWAQDWQFQLRVCDAAGTAVLSVDRQKAQQP
jgi:hypothetical protein